MCLTYVHTTQVKDLGVVGRGKRRVQPVAVQNTTTSSPPTGQKRSLDSLMGGMCIGVRV